MKKGAGLNGARHGPFKLRGDLCKQVSVVVSRASTSLGDALRAIDSKGCIGSDFVLMSGNTVTNMDLRAPLAEHKARREKDRNAIMTLVTTTPYLGHILPA